jgi:hypothetical protein
MTMLAEPRRRVGGEMTMLPSPGFELMGEMAATLPGFELVGG